MRFVRHRARSGRIGVGVALIVVAVLFSAGAARFGGPSTIVAQPEYPTAEPRTPSPTPTPTAPPATAVPTPAPTVVPAATATPAATAVPAAVAPGGQNRVDIIRQAFDLLMDQFYRTPDAADLLAAAYAGARDELGRAGAAGPFPDPPLLPSDRAGAWNAFATAYGDLAARAPAGLSQVDLAFAAISDMADSLNEQHTTFLTPAQYRSFTTGLGGGGTQIGLGLRIGARPPWVIREVAPDGPAERAGLRPGDTIVAVDGEDMTAVTRQALSTALARNAGETVTLTVDRPDDGPITLTVAVGPFAFPNVQSAVLEGGIGYIRLRQFTAFIDTPDGGRNVLQEFDQALAGFEAAGVTAWVIDLRDNPGGFGFTADALLGRFLTETITVQARDERGRQGLHATAGRALAVQRPMAVLINGGSASSSEIFSGTMQEYGRAVLVGTRSAGALAGALAFPLPEGAGLYVAVEEVLTGRTGTVVDEVGIRPDVIVNDTRTAADFAAGRDPQRDAAAVAVRSQPMPAPISAPAPGQLPAHRLRTLLTPYLPSARDIPATPLIPASNVLGDYTITLPNEWVELLGPVSDPVALAGVVRSRGWQGGYVRFYGEVPGLSGPFYAVQVDVYASQAGALDALNRNDAPQVLQSAAPPVQLGDGVVAYQGVWEAAGISLLMMRVGNSVVSLTYAAVPGQESFEPLISLARIVEARLRATPLPTDTPVPATAVP